MKFDTWLGLQILKHELLKGNLFVLFYGKLIGYELAEQGVIGEFKRCSRRFFVPYERIPYSKEKLKVSHRMGYAADHFLTNRPVKKLIYCIEVRNEYEILKIETINEHAYYLLKAQYDTVHMREEKKIYFGGKVIDCGGIAYSIGYYEEKKTFNNIVEYESFEKISVLPRT